jgi:hypothetical protein
MELRLTPSSKEGKDRLRQERRIVKIRNPRITDGL